mmetsp:Transcript_10552/g.10406  ORF Transcript_10552/g.10406 Transcript_10552/m.10406 type:complete len:157 (-) Transcript_10552:181-651(-)|eukprot:CAMPEP_0197015512 /NCGR_PEP_ID=MMETSP1380-20130617/74504_1 /TAXON_ID=5936 /ORGANISM="Euplotes crassus, Strain CT5" /LENGTH=156 /DNA_ID=CAMNT_0042441483 /DNA_START=118 /DNA_END=591 /DNA_ORIENTATION=+
MNFKRLSCSEKLIGNFPRGFVKIVDYVRKLQFIDIPDYDYMRWCFAELARENEVVLDNKYNWAYDSQKRNRLKSKSSKDLNNFLSSQNKGIGVFPRKRNYSLRKKRVNYEIGKPLGKSTCWKVCSNSDSVADRSIFKSSSILNFWVNKQSNYEESK